MQPALLLVSPEPVGERASRYLQLGRALTPSAQVTLAVPGTSSNGCGIRIVPYSCERTLRAAIDGSAIGVVPDSLFDACPSIGGTPARLVVDLTDRTRVHDAALRAGDFFLCGTESDREFWLDALTLNGRVSRRALRKGNLRRLIDVVPADPDADLERAIDPLRLYCTSTVREPRGWMWRAPSVAARALRILREHGARTLAERSVARVGRLAGAGSPTPRPPSPLAGRPRQLAARLASVGTIADFHDLLGEHELIGPDRRFMDLEIDVSNKCNIRCRMCYFAFDDTFHAKPVHLAPDTFAALADEVLPHAKAVMLSLGSEPLASPHFVPILERASRYGVPELGFYTNGLLFDDRIIDAIVEHDVTLVAISIDGATKKTYESIRRGADFDLLLRNVRALARRRAEAGRSNLRLRFGVVMMRDNIEELEDIVTLAWRLGVEELNFFHLVVYEGLEMDAQSLVHYKALSNHHLDRARARAHELGLTIVHNPSPFTLDGRGDGADSTHTSRVPYCRFPFFHVSIDSKGRVRPCPFSHGEPEYGVVTRENRFEQIWLGAAFNDLRKRILTSDPPAMCRRCSYLASSHPDLAQLFAPRTVLHERERVLSERHECTPERVEG